MKTVLFIVIMFFGSWWIGTFGTILMYFLTPKALKASPSSKAFTVFLATSMVVLTHEKDSLFYGAFTLAITGWWALSEQIYKFFLHFEPITRKLSGLRRGEVRSLESIEADTSGYEGPDY